MGEAEYILYNIRVLTASKKSVNAFRASKYSYAVYIPKELAENTPLLRISGEAELCGQRVPFALFLPYDASTSSCEGSNRDRDRLKKCIEKCMGKCHGEKHVCIEMCTDVCTSLVYGDV